MVEKAHVAEYLNGLLATFVPMSRRAGFETLTYILEMAELESSKLAEIPQPGLRAAEG